MVIHGTSGDDRLDFAAASWHQVTINGVHYAFDSAVVNTFTFDGGEGNDTAVLCGSAGDDTLVMRPTTATLSGPGYRVAVTAAETIIVLGAGRRRQGVPVRLGRRRFLCCHADATRTLYGDGFFNQAEGFRYVYAYATAGGTDKAYLYDSAGNDRFRRHDNLRRALRRHFLQLRQGLPLRLRLRHRRRHGQSLPVRLGRQRCLRRQAATTAPLYGAQLLQLRQGLPLRLRLRHRRRHGQSLPVRLGRQRSLRRQEQPTAASRGDSFYNYAKGFRYVYAYATAGGTDKAYLYDSARNDRLKASGNLAQIYSDRFSVSAVGFDWVQAVSSSGGKNTKAVRSIDFVLKTVGRWTKV